MANGPERAIGVSMARFLKGLFDVRSPVMKEDTAGPMKCSSAFMPGSGAHEPAKNGESSMLLMGSSANRI